MRTLYKSDKAFVDSLTRAAKNREILLEDIYRAIELIEKDLVNGIRKKGLFGYTKEVSGRDLFELQEKFLQTRNGGCRVYPECSIRFNETYFYLKGGFIRLHGESLPRCDKDLFVDELFDHLNIKLKVPEYTDVILGYSMLQEEYDAYSFFKDISVNAYYNKHLVSSFINWYNSRRRG